MKPDFALSLSFEGIRLLERTDAGWATVGEVPLDSPDLTAALADLRAEGVARAPATFGCKLIIPNDQIRYLALDDPRANEAAVRATLDGATPYAVDDLAYDFRAGGGRTWIAAVARETLDEAEAFAADHRLAPLAFVAVPEPFTFPGEVFFGPTRTAAAILPEGETVERDAVAARPLPTRPVPPGPFVTVAAPPASLAAAADRPAEPAAPPVAEEVTAPVAVDAPAPPAAPAETRPVAVETAPDAPEPAPAEPPPDAEPLLVPMSEQTPADTPGTAAPEPEEPVVFASRARPLRAVTEVPPPVRPLGAAAPSVPAPSVPGPADADPAAPMFTRRPPAGRTEPPLRAAAAETPSAPPAAPASKAPRPAPAAPAAPQRRVNIPPATAPAAPVLRGRSLEDIDADIPPMPAATAAAVPAPGPKAAAPAPRARKPRRIRLGLILTAILIALLALVALWSTTLEGGLAGLFGAGGETRVAATPEAAPVGADIAQTVALTLPQADPGAAPAVGDTDPRTGGTAAPLLALPEDAPDAVAGPAPEPAAPAPDPVAPAAAAPAAAPAGTLVTPEEADRVYAATGVWLRAPRLPLLPRTETVEDLEVAAPAADVVVAAAPAMLPAGPGLAPDAGLPLQPLPPAPGTVFDRDDRGLIRATPEGIVLPTGALLFAGTPALVPPTRPGTPAPPPREQPGALAEPPALRPALRPATIAAAAGLPAEPQAGITDPAADAAAAPPPGGVSLNGLRPAARPATVSPPAVWEGPSPALRPEGLAPAPPPEPEAAPEVPPEPDTPAEPDIDTALAAIVAAAADPLAGATAQAVPFSLRPDARPRNFDRVVQRQLDRIARAQAAAQQPAGGTGTGALSREEAAEQAETISDAAVEPSGAIPGGVAQAATFTDAINLREINLIGVFGSQNDRRAIVRLANGRLVRVNVGDSLDGGQVVAIGDNYLNYTRRGRTVTLEVPGG